MLDWCILSAITFVLAQDSQRVPFSFYRSEKAVNVNTAATFALAPSTLSAQSTLLGTVSIGKPAQSFNMLFDTGSGLFWVISHDNCTAQIAKKPSRCPGLYKYSTSASTTFNKVDKPKSSHYAYVSDTSLNCTILGTDDVYIGNTLVYSQHPICSAYYVQLGVSLAADLPYDGIMGLAPKNDDPEAIVNVASTFLPSMRTVSFWYNKTLLLRQNKVGYVNYTHSDLKVGMIVFGYDNSLRQLYNQKIASIPVAQTIPASWTVMLQSITVSGQPTVKLSTRHGQLLIDTGNPGANLPNAVWAELYKKLNPVVTEDGNYKIDCKSVPMIPAITFQFHGSQTPVVLNGNQQVLTTSECHCMLIFSPVGAGEPELSFGSVFLAQFFSVFDYTNGGSIRLYGTDSQKQTLCIPQIGDVRGKSRFDDGNHETVYHWNLAQTRRRSGSYHAEF
jgi:hypothetical protein